MATNVLPLSVALNQQQPQKPDAFEVLLQSIIKSQQQPLNITLPQLPAEEPMPQRPAEPHGFWQVLSRRFLPGLSAGLEGRDPNTVLEAEDRPYKQALEAWQLKSGMGQQRFQNQVALSGLQAQLANLNQSRLAPQLTVAEMMQRSREGAANRTSEENMRQMILNAERGQQERQQTFLGQQNEFERQNKELIARIMASSRVDAAQARQESRSRWMATIGSLFKPDPIKGGVVPPDEGTLAMFLKMAVADGAINDNEAMKLHQTLYPEQLSQPATAPSSPNNSVVGPYDLGAFFQKLKQRQPLPTPGRAPSQFLPPI